MILQNILSFLTVTNRINGFKSLLLIEFLYLLMYADTILEKIFVFLEKKKYGKVTDISVYNPIIIIIIFFFTISIFNSVSQRYWN